MIPICKTMGIGAPELGRKGVIVKLWNLHSGLKRSSLLSTRDIMQHLEIGRGIMKNILLILLFIFIYMENACNWLVDDQTVHGQVVKLIFIAREEVAAIRHYIKYEAIQNNLSVRITSYSYNT